MTENEIAEYLKAHPEFIAKYLDPLSAPTSNKQNFTTDHKVIALADRQIPQLQQKIRTLESQIDVFLENGRRNEEIWDSILSSMVALFEIMPRDLSPEAISSVLRKHLNIEECRVFIFSANQENTSKEEKTFANFIIHTNGPRCLLVAPEETKHFTKSWLLTSSAYIPLSIKNSIGILIFSSSNEQKFDPSIDTQFLGRIGNIVSTAIDNAYAHQGSDFTQHE